MRHPRESGDSSLLKTTTESRSVTKMSGNDHRVMNAGKTRTLGEGAHESP